MKFYENIAHGVPQLFPTLRLLHEIEKTGKDVSGFIAWIDPLNQICKLHHAKLLIEQVSECMELVDFYNREFTPFVYYFDSMEELKRMAEMRADEFDYKNVRVEGPKFYAKIREQSVETWKGMFREMGYFA
ncbi:hypothetical protein HDU98_005886 [Podochytrium sp. JEL0797]|nr:hypothetical protein HDU98_005886 [Podochytrium sp. JEL0797]